MQTWTAEMYGYAVVGHFTSHPTWEQLIWTADIDRLKGKVGRRQVRCIRNDMDEAETGRRTKKCSIAESLCTLTRNVPREILGTKETSALRTSPRGPRPVTQLETVHMRDVEAATNVIANVLNYIIVHVHEQAYEFSGASQYHLPSYLRIIHTSISVVKFFKNSSH